MRRGVPVCPSRGLAALGISADARQGPARGTRPVHSIARRIAQPYVRARLRSGVIGSFGEQARSVRHVGGRSERACRQVLRDVPLRPRESRRPRPRRLRRHEGHRERRAHREDDPQAPRADDAACRRRPPGRCDGDGDGRHARRRDGQARCREPASRLATVPAPEPRRVRRRGERPDRHRRGRQRLAPARHHQRRLRQRRRRPELLLAADAGLSARRQPDQPPRHRRQERERHLGHVQGRAQPLARWSAPPAPPSAPAAASPSSTSSRRTGST